MFPRAGTVFSCKNGAIRNQRPGHGLEIGEVFTSCSTDKQIHLCQLGKDRPIKSFHSHTIKVTAIKWESQEKFLMSCDDMTLNGWTMDRENCVQDLKDQKKDTHD